MQPEKQAFVEMDKLAVVGVSRSGTGFGNMALKSLRARGYQVFPVNAGADEVGGEKCYRSLEALPERVDGVIAVVKPEDTLHVIDDCARLGLTHLWMQQGSESPEAVARCQEKGLTAVHGACVLMYLKPRGFHAFHGWLANTFGKAA